MYYISVTLQAATLLAYDAVHAIIAALEGIIHSQHMSVNNVSCDTESYLEIGHTLYNYINTVSAHSVGLALLPMVTVKAETLDWNNM